MAAVELRPMTDVDGVDTGYAPHDPYDMQTVVYWLLNEGRMLEDGGALMRALVPMLVERGLPVWRATLHLPQLHPSVYAVAYYWQGDLDGDRQIRLSTFERSRAGSAKYHHSPIGYMHRTGNPVRRKLIGPDAEIDYPILEELKGLGASEYVLFPLPQRNWNMAALSLAAYGNQAFDDGQLRALDCLLAPLAAVAEVLIAHKTMGDLLNTYIGQEAGNRVLKGEITAGTARSIDAVIFFCDLRGFTGLSERLDRQPLLTLLDDYFDAMVRAVHAREGEVLKYMGDGLLAIFRIDETRTRQEACALAMMAASEAAGNLWATNETRKARGETEEIRAGIALHVGAVLFGNIGADIRLDFTVIGPAVNLAARIEAMCPVLNQPILTSAAFAATSPVKLVNLGPHPLKGVAEPAELFTLLTGGE